MNEVDILCVLETKNPVKPDKAVCPVKLDDAENPVKLDELRFPGRVDVVNLTGLLTSQRFSLWWEGGCLSGILCW